MASHGPHGTTSKEAQWLGASRRRIKSLAAGGAIKGRGMRSTNEGEGGGVKKREGWWMGRPRGITTLPFMAPSTA
jgi:hypothetical protein